MIIVNYTTFPILGIQIIRGIPKKPTSIIQSERDPLFPLLMSPGSQRGPLQCSHQQLHPLLVAGCRAAGQLVFTRADGCYQLQHDDHGTGEGVLMAGGPAAAEPGGGTGFSPGAVGGTCCSTKLQLFWGATAIIPALVKTWVKGSSLH